jgi:hypothetical protein
MNQVWVERQKTLFLFGKDERKQGIPFFLVPVPFLGAVPSVPIPLQRSFRPITETQEMPQHTPNQRSDNVL